MRFDVTYVIFYIRSAASVGRDELMNGKNLARR